MKGPRAGSWQGGGPLRGYQTREGGKDPSAVSLKVGQRKENDDWAVLEKKKDSGKKKKKRKHALSPFQRLQKKSKKRIPTKGARR